MDVAGTGPAKMDLCVIYDKNVNIDIYVIFDRIKAVKLPDSFNEDGLLPANDYSATLTQLKSSLLVEGPKVCSVNWDRPWRLQLIDNLAILAQQLWHFGMMEIFIDGSFVEEKDHPNDIDGYFVCDEERFISKEIHRDLNSLDPGKVWTWAPRSRTPAAGFSKLQLPMWHRYRVELYPHFGQGSGICDPRGYELEFPSAFRQTRGSGKPKGIIKLLQEVKS